MKYIAILGRQAELSRAELAALFGETRVLRPGIVEFESEESVEIDRLGGTVKLARPLMGDVVEFLCGLPEGKITLGVSDYDPRATKASVGREAWRLKMALAQVGRSVRLVPNNKGAVLETAAVLHNKLGRAPRRVELLRVNGEWFVGCGVQNIDAYARRDQARPARDAKVGMLPPKLAQILINLCGPLPEGARILDPFCGTGVLLQEAALMGYVPYGTDRSERMVEYSRKNLRWLYDNGALRDRTSRQPAVAGAARPAFSAVACESSLRAPFVVELGDATDYTWQQPIDAVACETYLGPPMSQPPAEIKLKTVRQEIRTLLNDFLRNLGGQIKAGTPVVLAIPAWLRPDGRYAKVGLLDKNGLLEYNGVKYQCLSEEPLLYHREGQVVARQIIILRKI